MTKKISEKVAEYGSSYIIKDTYRFILSNDASGTARIYLEVDYHKRKMTIHTPFFANSVVDSFRREFVFKDTDCDSAIIIGKLISDAGKVAKELLKHDQQYIKLNDIHYGWTRR